MRRLLQHWTESSIIPASRERSVWRNKRPKKRTVSSEEDRSLTWSTSSSGSLELMILSKIMPTYLQLFFEMMIFRNSIRNVTEFLWSMTKIPYHDILEGLYKFRIRESEKHKTVLELYNMEIHQKKAGPDYHRLKTMVKRSIEQNLRIKNLKPETEILRQTPWSRIRGQQREQRTLGDSLQWKANGQCSKGDDCSFRHDINKRAKTTQPNPSPSSKEMHREPEVQEAKVPVEGCFDCPARITSKELAQIHSVTNGILQNACFTSRRMDADLGEKCSYAHRQVEEQPCKRSKKNGDKSAVAMLKITRQLGCVFQDMEPPKSSSIFRKSSNTRKPIWCVNFTKAVVRHADIRDQNPSLGMICQVIPHQRKPNAPKFEDRSQEETERQERCAREAAWRLAKSIQKLKEKNKAAFFSPSENWCLLAPSNLKPEEREFVVDSGASMLMISKKDLNSAEMDTLTTSCSPTIVITANGEVQTHEEATVYVKELEKSWQWKSSRIHQQYNRSESFAMKTDTLMSGSRVKNHISSKTVFAYNVTQRTSFRWWFLVCQRLLPVFPLQHPWHLQGRRLIILRLP